jgi:hypothetical protein
MAHGVAANRRISATFSEPLMASTVSEATFLLAQGAMSIPGTVSYTGKTATFTPAASLDFQTTYTATITTGVKDLAGNALQTNYVWSFTTGAEPDTTPPTIVSTSPAANATGVPINQGIIAEFSEPVALSSVNSTTFTLSRGAISISGTVTASGTIASFTPTGGLVPSSSYTATITTGVTDLAGNALATPYSFDFTTGATPDTTPPTVLSTSPPPGAGNVPSNVPVTARFSKPMSPATINSSTFTLLKGNTPVAGTVSYANNVATFTPSAALDLNTSFAATISTGVKDLAGNSMASSLVWSFTTSANADTTPPTVASTTPAAGASSVSPTTTVTVQFSEPVAPSTVTGSTVLLKKGPVPVAGTVSVNGSTAVFTPAAPLDPATAYKATVTTGITDLAGNALTMDFTFGFTTAAAADTTPPAVTLTAPVNGATGVGLNSALSVTFSKPMAPATISATSFTVASGSTPVMGSVSYSGTTAVFTPTAALDANKSYTASISATATDVAGNPLPAYTWSFTTGSAPDTTAPTVVSMSPAASATGVAVNTGVSAGFSEPMAPATITSGSFTLAKGATPIAGTVSYTGTTATFRPSTTLDPSSTYTATVTTSATDLAGNHLPANATWTFTTGQAQDITPPAVASTSPVGGAMGVPIASPITATFSEALDPATITSASFTLGKVGTRVAGTVVLSGKTATFTPLANLDYNTTFTATVTTAVRDLAGNNLPASFTWSFTTTAAPDTTPPTVVSTTPANATTNVDATSAVTATFSKAMIPSSLTTAFQLTGGMASVSGTVTYNGTTATFTPAAPLAFNTTYSATIDTGAKDLAGNAMVAAYTWSFSTQAPDLIPPTVVSTDPPSGATDVEPTADVTVTFSERMAAATLTESNFTVQSAAGPIAGVVTSSPAGAPTTATFSPNGTYPLNAMCTATVSGAVTDAAGNELDGGTPYSWQFKTRDGTWSPDGPTVIANVFYYYFGTPSTFYYLCDVNPDSLAVAMDPNGNALVLWSQQETSTSCTVAVDGGSVVGSFPSRLWANRYTANVGWGNPERISIGTEDINTRWRPSVAMDRAGNALAVWIDTSNHVWARRFDANSGQWGPESEQVIQNAGGQTCNQFPHSKIGFDFNGNAFVAWTEKSPTPDGGTTACRIWANRFTTGGTSLAGWGMAQPVYGGSPQDATDDFPLLTVFPSGDALAVWTVVVPVDGGARVDAWWNRYSAASGSWGTASALATGNPPVFEVPSDVAGNANGSAIALWSDVDVSRPPSTGQLWASRYNVASGAWDSPVALQSNAQIILTAFAAMSERGDATALWYQRDILPDGGGAGGSGIWASRSPFGQGWTAPQLIEGDAGTAPDLSGDPVGNAIAAWPRQDPPAPDAGTTYSAYVNRFAVGTGWQRFSQALGSQLATTNAPQAAVNSSGKGIVVWLRQRFVSSPYEYEHDVWAITFQ